MDVAAGEPLSTDISAHHLKRKQDVEAFFLPWHTSVLQDQRQRPDRDRAALCGLHQRPPPDARTQPQRYKHSCISPFVSVRLYVCHILPLYSDVHLFVIQD